MKTGFRFGKDVRKELHCARKGLPGTCKMSPFTNRFDPI